MGAGKSKKINSDLERTPVDDIEIPPTVTQDDDDPLKAALGGKWPCKERKRLCRELQENIHKGNNLLPVLAKIRSAIGLENNDTLGRPDLHFIVDESGVQMVLDLTRLLNVRAAEWDVEADHLCHRLIHHYGVPSHCTPKPMPRAKAVDLDELALGGVDLTKKANQNTLLELIRNNSQLTSVELCFTNLQMDYAEKLLPDLVGLKALTYLGLRGNCLNSSLMERMLVLMESSENFPCLMWVDVRNNYNIFTLSKALLSQLRSRWPQSGYQPSFRELADGQAVVLDQMMDINV